MSGEHENEITDFDREVAEAVAEQFGVEPDYEQSAQARREVQSASMYAVVYGLPWLCGQALVFADDHERYATESGWLTPAVAFSIADIRRLAWAGDGEGASEALMATVQVLFAERRK